MKKTFTLLFAAATITAFAQAPVLNIVTEEISIPEPALSTIQAELGATPHTIRVYAEFPDNYEVQLQYGIMGHPWSISSADGFYQNVNGGATTLSIIPELYPTFPELEYDSWVTIGYTSQSPNDLFPVPFDMNFFDAWEAGGDFLVDDFNGASISVLAQPFTFPPNTPDENGQVLLGQYTSSSDISSCMNLQLRRLNPDGTIYDPPGSPTSEVWVYNDLCFTHSFNPVTCTGDFDFNGVVATSDLLLFMPDFGCTSGCSKDLTGDDAIGTPDLLVFLGYFGTSCP